MLSMILFCFSVLSRWGDTREISPPNGCGDKFGKKLSVEVFLMQLLQWALAVDMGEKKAGQTFP